MRTHITCKHAFYYNWSEDGNYEDDKSRATKPVRRARGYKQQYRFLIRRVQNVSTIAICCVYAVVLYKTRARERERYGSRRLGRRRRRRRTTTLCSCLKCLFGYNIILCISVLYAAVVKNDLSNTQKPYRRKYVVWNRHRDNNNNTHVYEFETGPSDRLFVEAV